MDGTDFPTWLIRSSPVDTDVHRRERSWTLAVGSRRLSFTRVEYQTGSLPRLVIDHGPPSRMPLTGALALVLGSIAGLAMLGLALQTTRAAPIGGYRLSVAIPAKSAVRSPDRAGRQVAAVTVAPVVVKPIALPVTPAPATAIEAPASSDVEPVRITAMQPAIGAALRTGTLQQWASMDGAEHGFVVAGPAEHGCRTLSILTRRDGDNAVQTRRACLNGEDVRVASEAPATAP